MNMNMVKEESVTGQLQAAVHDLKLSSVVPSKITSEEDAVRVLTNGDLVMKLHYVKGIYYFSPTAAQGLNIGDIKEHMMSRWLNLYYPVSGRIRRQDPDGRPIIKCNDSGVRIVEARCDTTVDEWLEMAARGQVDQTELLYPHVLGPDLGFSPLVYIQFTWFNCGGISLGLSWAHVLGDALSASSFINMWGRIMAGQLPPETLHVATTQMPESPTDRARTVAPVRQVDPTGDTWITASSCKMNTSYIRITRKQLDFIKNGNLSDFETLSAMVWKSLSKIRGDTETKIVTICMNNHSDDGVEYHLPVNSMIISTVEANCSISEASVSEVAEQIAKRKMHANAAIEEMVERDPQSDFVVFGANLTFVNLEGVDVYGLELRGQKPVFANYFIGGVGNVGAVLVIPWQEDGKAKKGGDGRIVTMILPEHEVAEAARDLMKEIGLP